jgi:hypothetical protein
MRTVIIHGKRVSDHSPRHGRPACDLWGVTRANARFWHGRLHDWTEWTDVHPLVPAGRFTGIPERRPDAWSWMKRQDGSRPIFLQAPEHHPREHYQQALDRFSEIPGAVRFPIREIQKAFPIQRVVDGVVVNAPNTWFVEQTGMMIAHALLRGYQRIILNGVGCVTRIDWQVAHRSILYWMAEARGRGVIVEVEGPSIFHTPAQLYAYERFNYEEFEQAQLEVYELVENGPANAIKADINARERARGRPIRHKITLPGDGDVW